jgi:hypothetical protein
MAEDFVTIHPLLIINAGNRTEKTLLLGGKVFFHSGSSRRNSFIIFLNFTFKKLLYIGIR